MFCQVRGKSRVFDIKIERRAATRHPRDASTVNQIFSRSSPTRSGLHKACPMEPSVSFHCRPPQQTSGKIASLAPEQIPQSKRKSRDVLIAPEDFYRRVINCLIYNENYERERVYKFKAVFCGRRSKTLRNDPRWHFYEELSRIHRWIDANQ